MNKFILLCFALLLLDLAVCQDGVFFLKASKNIPRIGKRENTKPPPPSGGGNDDFEKFFLKASKSVPRIGRRGYEPMKSADGPFKFPLWSTMQEMFDYNPELINTPQILKNLEEFDPHPVEDWPKNM